MKYFFIFLLTINLSACDVARQKIIEFQTKHLIVERFENKPFAAMAGLGKIQEVQLRLSDEHSYCNKESCLEVYSGRAIFSSFEKKIHVTVLNDKIVDMKFLD